MKSPQPLVACYLWDKLWSRYPGDVLQPAPTGFLQSALFARCHFLSRKRP